MKIWKGYDSKSIYILFAHNVHLEYIDIHNKKIYDSLIEGCSNSNINSSKYKIEKIFKTNDFGIESWTQFKDIPIHLLEKEENYSKFVNYVMNLPTKIIEDNFNKIKGAIIFMDEIQALKDLGDDLKGFLCILEVKSNFKKMLFMFLLEVWVQKMI